MAADSGAGATRRRRKPAWTRAPRRGPPRRARSLRLGAVLVVIVLAAALPLFVSGFRLFQFTQVLIYAIALLGLNLLTGYNGQFSLGHGAFYNLFQEGVGSFSWLIGAGGVGVLLGLLTVGRLDDRFSRQRIIAGSFILGGITLLLVALFLDRWTVLLASFAVGLAFAWKKVPVDTMVQEAVPDGLRGRVFSVYDVMYNLSRLAGGLLAIPLLNRLSPEASAAFIGLVFILWAPVLPLWLRHAPDAIRLLFYEGGRAEEWPRAVSWATSRNPSRSSDPRPSNAMARVSARSASP